jgi:molybdenum-dependent DNA-binding transcriptional regulator ModE
MENRTLAPPADSAPDFTPVPRLCKRHDGWTLERQRAFIEALAETGSAATACRMVNMSLATAYALRHHAQGASFARA